jgi:hypothetical protein
MTLVRRDWMRYTRILKLLDSKPPVVLIGVYDHWQASYWWMTMLPLSLLLDGLPYKEELRKLRPSLAMTARITLRLFDQHKDPEPALLLARDLDDPINITLRSYGRLIFYLGSTEIEVLTGFEAHHDLLPGEFLCVGLDIRIFEPLYDLLDRKLPSR